MISDPTLRDPTDYESRKSRMGEGTRQGMGGSRERGLDDSTVPSLVCDIFCVACFSITCGQKLEATELVSLFQYLVFTK